MTISVRKTLIVDRGVEPSMDQAAGCAADIAQSGRCLQLSPASENFDLFKNFKARELAFTDEVQTLCA